MRSGVLERPVFLGGAPRSGLTLLRAILDAHPGLSAGPDVWLPAMALAERDLGKTLGTLLEKEFALDPEARRRAFARAISTILGGRAAAAGKARTVEKTPLNVLAFTDLALLFPDALFVHIVRDGRDVAASLMARAWTDPRSGNLLPQCASPDGAAQYWSDLAGLGVDAERALGDRVIRLRYEDLVADSERVLRRLFAFLGEAYSDVVLRFHEREIPLVSVEREGAASLRRPLNGDHVARWRRDFDDRAAALVTAIAGARLAALGYA